MALLNCCMITPLSVRCLSFLPPSAFLSVLSNSLFRLSFSLSSPSLCFFFLFFLLHKPAFFFLIERSGVHVPSNVTRFVCLFVFLHHCDEHSCKGSGDFAKEPQRLIGYIYTNTFFVLKSITAATVTPAVHTTPECGNAPHSVLDLKLWPSVVVWVGEKQRRLEMMTQSPAFASIMNSGHLKMY